MCGIAGIIHAHAPDIRLQSVKGMLARMYYRGPDESGIYHSRNATLGNVRLSIIDLDTGQQPISDLSGRYWIVFNGEIYNYIELREDLLRKGIHLKTSSDTEVLVQLYAMHGKACLQQLNGQFAFAIWDKEKQELFAARDRTGIRPFYFYKKHGGFIFASEIKSIFENTDVEKALNPAGLLQMMTFWTTITPSTVFNEIEELSPGHYLTFSQKGISIQRYWQLSFNDQPARRGLDTYLEEFHELFSDAVRIRLRADVEVAAYLSGGLDSSATVAYIKEIAPEILNTFSITFGERDFDERDYQRQAIDHFRTSHYSIECTAQSIAENFPRVVWQSEIPMIRTAPAPMMILSGLVRQHGIKVVITGEGADEMLAGYNIFKENEVRRFWARQPGSQIRPLLLARLYPYLPHLQQARPNMLKMFFGYRLQDVDNPLYSHLLRWNNSGHIAKHLSNSFREISGDYEPLSDVNRMLPEGFSTWDSLQKAQWLETTIFMSGYLLSSQGDRMGMANSVEGRYPFLDHRLIEFLSSVPSQFKLKGLEEKYLLKKVVNDKIPGSIVKRSKQAYRAPISSVFFSDELTDYIKYMISDEYLRKTDLFDPESVESLIKKVRNNQMATETENMAITAIVSTQMLNYQFIEGKNSGLSVKKLENLKVIEE